MENSAQDLDGSSLAAAVAEERAPLATAIVVIALVAVLVATWWVFVRHDLQIKAPASDNTNVPAQVDNS